MILHIAVDLVYDLFDMALIFIYEHLPLSRDYVG